MPTSRRGRISLRSIQQPTMPAIRTKRAASVELGEGDFAVKYNSNGRPVRKSAGKKFSPIPGYVDSGALDQQLLEITADDLSDPESDLESEEEEVVVKKKSKKRKRTPSPTPPPLSPLPPVDISSDRESPEPLSLDVRSDLIDLEPIQLTFNIQPGFSGPLQVQLDLSQVPLRGRKRNCLSGVTTLGSSAKVKSKAASASQKGFLSLPPELRNKVYRLLFKSKDKIDFVEPTNIARSSAFLRTCKQIHEEGRTILYGENMFYFGRNKEMRRPFWVSERKEIGYKDLRLFLRLIGFSNISYLRQMWLCFDDAVPSAVPHLRRNEERRFVHDSHLIECLKTLAKNARLKKLTFTFWGRKTLAVTDSRFLEHLCKVKADQVDFRMPYMEYYYWHSSNRIHEDTKTLIKKEVVRKNKLYED